MILPTNIVNQFSDSRKTCLLLICKFFSKYGNITIVLENDGRYCLTEKFIYDEMAYMTCMKSAKELYGEPLRRMEILSGEEYDLLFEKLLKVADECHKIITEVSKSIYYHFTRAICFISITVND